jgi:pimeloyl-ACP methyl ester carboxylesterase
MCPARHNPAVRNAFATAPAFAANITSSAYPGPITVAGHSAGCMLIASAIADCGLNVNNVCFMDAAIAREAFDGNEPNDVVGMTPTVWQGYPPQLMASNWYLLFSGNTSDARGNLTWNLRFQNATPFIYNFYSSTEDVLAAYSGDVPTGTANATVTAFDNGIPETLAGIYAWVLQEKAKGNGQYYFSSIPVGSNYMGWGFNLEDHYWDDLASNGTWVPKSASELTPVTTAMLSYAQTSPFFNNGYDSYGNLTGPSWVPSLYINLFGTGSDTAADNRNQLLAEAIPALSLPAGANLINNLPSEGPNNVQYNMPTFAVRDGGSYYWPSELGINSSALPNWHHSNMREVAYPYLWQFYDQLVTISKQ